MWLVNTVLKAQVTANCAKTEDKINLMSTPDSPATKSALSVLRLNSAWEAL